MVKRHCDRDGCDQSELVGQIDTYTKRERSTFIEITAHTYGQIKVGMYCSWACLKQIVDAATTDERRRRLLQEAANRERDIQQQRMVDNTAQVEAVLAAEGGM